jgi:ABC-2 type transport system permease protein
VSEGTVACVRSFAHRDLRVALSYPAPFALEAIGAVFTLATTWFVSKLVDAGSVPGGYFAFVTVGLAVGAFLYAGITVTARNVGEEKQRGTLEVIVSSGAPMHALAIGMTVYPVAAASVTATVYLLVAGVFGVRVPDANWSLAAAAAFLGAVSFAGLGVIGAALVLVIQRATGAVAWLVAMLSFAAGEFFPRELLPGWLQALGTLSPVTWTLQVVRAALLEGASWSDRWAAVVLLASMAVLAWAIGVVALGGGLGVARRRGTLAGY